MPMLADLSHNRLLAALDAASREHIRPRLKRVDLVCGQALFEAGDAIDRVYFPTSGAVCTTCVFEDGTSAEVSMVGSEGALPAAALLHGETVLARHVVQISGAALVTDRVSFHRVLEQNPLLQRLVFDYLQTVVAEAQQVAACNAVHSAERRLARWLLMCHDRTDTDSFPLTQEFLSEMLGVHRLTINAIAQSFQRAGLIRRQNRKVTVLDRDGLERTTCECYAIICRQHENLALATR